MATSRDGQLGKPAVRPMGQARFGRADGRGDQMAHILVVDDDPRVLPAMKRALERPGHEVTTAGGGEEALRCEVPDLLVLRGKVMGVSMVPATGRLQLQRLRGGVNSFRMSTPIPSQIFASVLSVTLTSPASSFCQWRQLTPTVSAASSWVMPFRSRRRRRLAPSRHCNCSARERGMC